MKTSNKLFVAAVALVLGSLATYDAALRAEYRTGHYKDPLHNYDALAFRNFDNVTVPAAGVLNVKIVAGPFGVHVNKEAAEFVHVSQQGARLTVALAYGKEYKWLGRNDAVVISCPRLAALATEGTYTVAGRPQLDRLQAGGNVRVQGFRQDSLRLQQDRSSEIELKGNTLGWLGATAGTRPGSEPHLDIAADNHIQTADLTIGHQGHLELGTAIPRLRYRFSDSTSVVLTGAAARSLNTPK
ncbi:hypothetical protein ACVWYF_001961 [Hymenobacter sp. UYAg731]